jgi:hypothetical protein
MRCIQEAIISAAKTNNGRRRVCPLVDPAAFAIDVSLTDSNFSFPTRHKSGYLQVNETHTNWGEFFGVVLWLWVFYRARQDLPVVLGYRHPWEHGDDHHGDHEEHHHSKPDKHTIEEKWDKFSVKAMKLSEDDDDDEDEEDEEE